MAIAALRCAARGRRRSARSTSARAELSAQPGQSPSARTLVEGRVVRRAQLLQAGLARLKPRVAGSDAGWIKVVTPGRRPPVGDVEDASNPHLEYRAVDQEPVRALAEYQSVAGERVVDIPFHPGRLRQECRQDRAYADVAVHILPGDLSKTMPGPS